MPTTPATSIHIAQPAAKRAGDPNQFTDIVATGLTTSAARAAIDRHAAALPKLRLLWSYYRNQMEHRGGWSATAVSSRGWRLSQERGLPGRLLGAASGGGTGDDRSRARKEIVIENDIAWRIHTMVDFMFGQRVRIASTARDPALRARIDAVIDAVWEASGGIALMQDMALLGNVYGHVDLIVRAFPTPSDTSAGRGEGAQTPRGAAGTGEEGTPDRSEALVEIARQSVRIEMIEPTRGVALLSPDDYRTIAAYILRYRRQSPGDADKAPPASRRFNFWKRVVRGFTGEPEDEPADNDGELITEIVGPSQTRVYAQGQNGEQLLIGAFPSLIAGSRPGAQPPVVHIQNLSQPFQYEGLSEVEPLIPLQDELNTRLSDRASRVTMQSFKMYLAKGIDGAGQLPVAPGTIWATDNADAQITPFGGDDNAPSELEHIEQVRESMDKQSGVPPLAAGVVRAKIGNLSSENALKITLMGLLSKTSRKRVAYGQGIARVCGLILEALHHMGVLETDPIDRGVRVDWPDPLPRDERQTLEAALRKIELGVPRQRVLSELGYTVDPPLIGTPTVE